MQPMRLGLPAVSAVNDRHLCLKALDMALRRRCPGAGLLHHSDRVRPTAARRRTYSTTSRPSTTGVGVTRHSTTYPWSTSSSAAVRRRCSTWRHDSSAKVDTESQMRYESAQQQFTA